MKSVASGWWRNTAIKSFHIDIQDIGAPAACLMQHYLQRLLSHPELEQRGHLWLGHWPPTLRQALGPLLQDLSLREGKSALLRFGARVTQAYCALWDGYMAALATALPPTPEIGFTEDLNPSCFLTAPQTPATADPSTPLATSPWTARLEADYG